MRVEALKAERMRAVVELGRAGADAWSRPARDGPGKLRAAKGSRAGQKEGKGGDAGPAVSLAGLKWKEGIFFKSKSFSISEFHFFFLIQNHFNIYQIKHKYDFDILLIPT